MAAGFFGRTNQELDNLWLGLMPPHDFNIDLLVRHAVSLGVPIDISNQPGLFGGSMRGTNAYLTARFNPHLDRANGESHAADLVQAEAISILSCVGRERIDIFFLTVDAALEEFQITGALMGLENLKQEGMVGSFGIHASGHPMAVKGVWQFHDAFDALLVSRNQVTEEAFNILAPTALERRVGIVTNSPFGSPPSLAPSLRQEAMALLLKEHSVVVPVSSIDDIDQAVQAKTLRIDSTFKDWRQSALKVS